VRNAQTSLPWRQATRYSRAVIPRRSFLGCAAAAPLAVSLLARGAPGTGEAGGIVDTNVTLERWPTRRVHDSPRLLVERLRRHGVVSAWAGSFEGVLHSDIAAANARLAEACARQGGGVLVPFGTVNPTLPDWPEDVRRCHEVHHMRGLRLYPSYHDYTLDDARFVRLLELAAERRLLVQIVLSIEDDRSQNPALTARPVQAAPLADVLPKVAGARVMLLNAFSRVLSGNTPLLQRFAALGNVGFEIATLEGAAGIETLLARVPGVRLLFGSHAPYYYFESALLKLQESALNGEQLAAITFGNARTALAFP